MASPQEDQTAGQGAPAAGALELSGWWWFVLTVGAVGFVATPLVFAISAQTVGYVVLDACLAAYLVVALVVRFRGMRMVRRGGVRWFLPITVVGILLVALLSKHGALGAAAGVTVVAAVVLVVLIVRTRQQIVLEPRR